MWGSCSEVSCGYRGIFSAVTALLSTISDVHSASVQRIDNNGMRTPVDHWSCIVKSEQRITVDDQPVLVRRSSRRWKTVSARWEGGVMCLAVPATLSDKQVESWARKMRKRLGSKPSAARSDEALMRRAEEISREVFDGRGVPSSIRWVTNQRMRWGSATLSTGAVRISHLLEQMPQWVIDYVIGHEMAHLIVPDDGHGKRFKALESKIPRAAEAKAFLDGVVWARRLGGEEPNGEDPNGDDPAGNEPGGEQV